MKKLALALAATAAFAGQAIAADMPARMPVKAAPVVAPVANWTGCYVSGGIGYGMWQQENTVYTDPSLGGPKIQLTDHVDAGGRGWLGRVGAGCDYQFGMGSWNMLIGVFGDYDFTDIHGRTAIPFFNFAYDEKMSSQWAVGGRIGWLVTPQLLSYFSGGYTEAKFDGTNSIFTQTFPPVAVVGWGLPGQTYKGWFLGSGLEYALAWAPGLTVKTEYRFSEFDVGTNQLRVLNTPVGEVIDSKKYVQTVTTSLSYKFNFGGAPLVAKY